MTAKKASSTPKYDPAAKYKAVKVISHPLGKFVPGDGKTFDMKHRSADQVEYLADVIKAIEPA